MSSEPHAFLIYGFELDDDSIGLCDDSAECEAWETIVAERLGPGDLLEPPGPVRHGAMFDCPYWAFGLILAETGDWGDVATVEVFTPPSDADARIAEACAHFGVEFQPCKILLLAGYG